MSKALSKLEMEKGVVVPREVTKEVLSGIDLRSLLPGLDAIRLWQAVPVTTTKRESPKPTHRRQSSGLKPARQRAHSHATDTHSHRLTETCPSKTSSAVPAHPTAPPPTKTSEEFAASFRDEAVSLETSPVTLLAALERTKSQRDKMSRMFLHQRAQAEGYYAKWMASEQKQQGTVLRMVSQASMLQELNNVLRKIKTERSMSGPETSSPKSSELHMRCAALSDELDDTKTSHQALSQALVDLSVSFNERLRSYHTRRACVHCEHVGEPSDDAMWREKFESCFAALQRNNEHVFRLQNQLRAKK